MYVRTYLINLMISLDSVPGGIKTQDLMSAFDCRRAEAERGRVHIPSPGASRPGAGCCSGPSFLPHPPLCLNTLQHHSGPSRRLRGGGLRSGSHEEQTSTFTAAWSGRRAAVGGAEWLLSRKTVCFGCSLRCVSFIYSEEEEKKKAPHRAALSLRRQVASRGEEETDGGAAQWIHSRPRRTLTHLDGAAHALPCVNATFFFHLFFVRWESSQRKRCRDLIRLSTLNPNLTSRLPLHNQAYITVAH